MESLIYLIPAALFLGLIGLAGFMWSLRSNQYEDLEGATYRALFEEDDIEEENKALYRNIFAGTKPSELRFDEFCDFEEL